MFRIGSSGSLIVVVAWAASATAQTEATPRHIEDLGRGGLLTSPTGDAPELTSVAGPRFTSLMPDSKKEVCRIVLEHHANLKRGIYRLRVVNERDREIMVCSL